MGNFENLVKDLGIEVNYKTKQTLKTFIGKSKIQNGQIRKDRTIEKNHYCLRYD